MITHEDIDALEVGDARKGIMHRRIDGDQCPALIWHGPGHQSTTYCDMPNSTEHDVHYTAYGSKRVFAEWTGIEATTGFFDEPPELDD